MINLRDYNYNICADDSGILVVDGKHKFWQDRCFIALGSPDGEDYFSVMNTKFDNLSNCGKRITGGFHDRNARIAGFFWREADG